jgi:CBS-domain-containing membrane protein
LGYSYELAPILLNTVTILIIAIAFNAVFKWRRYPAHMPFIKQTSSAEADIYAPINHEDFVYALSHIDTYVDITEEDVLKIYTLATKRHVEDKSS